MLPLFAVALAAALWALAAVIASDLFDAGVTPFELAEARAVVAMAGLACAPSSWTTFGRTPWEVLVPFGLALALVTATYYVAIERLPVAIGVVLQYTAPALVVAWTAFVRRRRPSPTVLVSLGAALAGVTLVTGVVGGDLGGLDPLGIAMGFGAAVFFSAYTLLAERARHGLSATGVMLRGFAVASAFWVVLQIPNGWPTSLFEVGNLPGVVFVGVGGTLAPFLLYVWAIARVRAERAAIAATLEPVLAALLAWALLGQTLTAAQLLGGVAVLAAVAILQRRPK
ncbi:EamA family transporter [soil metagenome]